MSKDTVPSRRFEHLGLESNSLHLSRDLVRDLAKHCNGDTKSLPRFRPPCGVTPYSCLSDRLHCAGYSTSVELELFGGSFGCLMDLSLFYGGKGPLFIVALVLLPTHWAGKDTTVGAQTRSLSFVVLVHWGDKLPS